MRRRKIQLLAAAAIACFTIQAAQGSIIDNFDDQSGPHGSPYVGYVFNGTVSYANVGGDNQLTLTESPLNKDSGFIWEDLNSQRIAITPDTDLITITSVGPATSGSKWDVVVELSTIPSGGTLTAFPDISGDTTATSFSFKISDVMNTPDRNGDTGTAGGATYFDLKLRTQPYSHAGYAWTYTSITATAVPEPASLGLLGVAGLGLLSRRRRHA